MKFTLIALLSLISAIANASEWKSIYTDLSKDCVEISSATEQAPIDFYEAECKAFGGFQLRIEGSDLRYSPALSFGEKAIELNRPMSFHDMGSDKIEWMYEISRDEEGSGKMEWKGLIYRLSVADIDDYEKDTSLLYVTRLDGAKSCHLGKVKTNEAARKLVMDSKAKCIDNDQYE
jgi:hypothetical protein